ncbi:Gluconate transport-inducing protein, partial [Coemansia nantahalensis]
MGDTRMESYYGFVSTSEDALALFEACRLGYKQRVPRRLSDSERAAIRSGSVFVWEECESGMKRWTDGRSWSPSRVQGCFLTYHEWEGRRRAQRHPSLHAMHGFNLPANMHSLPGQPIPMGIARYGHFIGGPTKAGSTQVQYGFPKENGMLKKALSISTTDGKRLHIIAYYTKEDQARRRLLTPTSDPNFPKLVVPPNLYPDMSPESMYGASHSLATLAPAGAFGDAAAADRAPQSSATPTDAGDCHSPSSLNPRDGGPAVSSRHTQRPTAEHVGPDLSAGHAPPLHPQPGQLPHRGRKGGDAAAAAAAAAGRRLSPLGLRPHVAAADHASATSAAAVDALSVGLHKARVQSLLVDSDVPSPSSLMSAGHLRRQHEASCPAAEQHNHPRHHAHNAFAYAHPHYPHSAHPMSAPSSMAPNGGSGSSSSSSGGAAASSTRPTSNSFSGPLPYAYGGARGMSAQHEPHPQQRQYHHHHNQLHYEAALGLSGSSASAPASTMMHAAAAAGSAGSSVLTDMSLTLEPQTALPIVSEAILMDAPPDLAHRRGMGGGGGGADDRCGRKYLGLGGSLGLGPRRSTALRSASTAAVLVHHPYAGPMSARVRGSPPGDRLARSPPRTAIESTATRLHSASQMPLLLSPVNPPRHTRRSGSYAGAQHISLAAIRRDVKEGPRRLPSISDSLRRESPPAGPTYALGGLGIFNAGVPSSRTPSSLLPSPLPTPRQSLPGEFD